MSSEVSHPVCDKVAANTVTETSHLDLDAQVDHTQGAILR